MAFSGMLRCVALVRTGVSEEHITSIIRVARISKLGTMLAVTSNQNMLHSSEMSIFARATQHHIPEDSILHSHCHENLIPYILIEVSHDFTSFFHKNSSLVP
jgi:hypothetical protein